MKGNIIHSTNILNMMTVSRAMATYRSLITMEAQCMELHQLTMASPRWVWTMSISRWIRDLGDLVETHGNTSIQTPMYSFHNTTFLMTMM